MKLEHFFFGLFALLLAFTGMLAMHYRGELQMERRLHELSRQAPAVPQAAVPAVPAAPSANGVVEQPATALSAAEEEKARLQRQLELAENEKQMLSDKVKKMETNEKAGLPADAPDLSAFQIKIKEAPAISRVKEYVSDQGIAVLDSGSARGLKTGQVYAVRRGHFIVAKKIEIGETVEENECAALVDSSALQPGEVLKPGDEIIQWE